MDTSELESDPDLTRVDEPDSWSSTIDKKAMKKMSLSKKDVKRQENIFGRSSFQYFTQVSASSSKHRDFGQH